MSFVLDFLKNNEKANLYLLRKTIEVTVPDFMNKELKNIIISAEELFLITQFYKYSDILEKTDKYSLIIDDALKYIDENLNCNVTSNIYSIYIIDKSKIWMKECDYGNILNKCNLVLEKLNNASNMYMMIEILNLKISVMKFINKDTRFINEQLQIVNELYYQFDINKDSIKWYPFSLANNVIDISKVVKNRSINVNIKMHTFDHIKMYVFTQNLV